MRIVREDIYTNATYTVELHFEANGGETVPAGFTRSKTSNDQYVDVTATIPSTAPTRFGYNFLGYSKGSASNPVTVQAGETVTENFTRTTTGSSQRTYEVSEAGGETYQVVETTYYSQNKYRNVYYYAQWEAANAVLNSVSDVDVGEQGTAAWTKIDNAHTYKLVLSCGGQNDVVIGNIAAGSESCNFTIPSSWYADMPNSASISATATLFTYSNGTELGSSSKTFTVSVPGSVKPSISAFTAVAHSQNQVADGWGVAVQGYSYLALSVTAQAGTGASIAGVLFSGQGINQASAATTGNTAVLTDAGTSTYTVTVTDSRGRSTTTNLNVTVYEYANPTVSSLQAVRCLSDGTQSDVEGDYLKALPIFVYSPVNGNNSLSVKKIEYKKHTVSSWTVGVASATTGVWSSVFGPADITKTYDVRCVVTDALNNTYTLAVIVPPVVGFALGLENDRARFGGPVEKAGLQVDWATEFNGAVDVTQRRCINKSLSSAGWYRVMNINSASGRAKTAWMIDIEIGTSYTNNPNEVHSVRLFGMYDSYTFANESSKAISTVGITKIRYTQDASYNGYIDIYYARTSANYVNVNFKVWCTADHISNFVSNQFTAVVDAPAGETVKATYTFFANSDADHDMTAFGKSWHFRKRNGIVYVDAYEKMTPTASGANSIGTLPAGFRPKYSVALRAANISSGYKTLFISPAGAVTAYCYTTVNEQTDFAISGSYIANS